MSAENLMPLSNTCVERGKPLRTLLFVPFVRSQRQKRERIVEGVRAAKRRLSYQAHLGDKSVRFSAYQLVHQ